MVSDTPTQLDTECLRVLEQDTDTACNMRLNTLLSSVWCYDIAEDCAHIMSTGGQYNPSGKPLVGQKNSPWMSSGLVSASEGQSGVREATHTKYVSLFIY